MRAASPRTLEAARCWRERAAQRRAGDWVQPGRFSGAAERAPGPPFKDDVTWGWPVHRFVVENGEMVLTAAGAPLMPQASKSNDLAVLPAVGNYLEIPKELEKDSI